jgi:arylsulfatase A-like enzyme
MGLTHMKFLRPRHALSRPLLAGVASLLCAVAFLPASSGQAADRPPNVIIVYTDDQGSVDANCYGSTDLLTPNIDRLAKSGVRFTQMLAPSAICSASRAGLMTGRFPARAGVPGNVPSEKGKAGMPSSEVTLAEMLKAKGYATGHVGKWHLGYTPETMPNAQGFDHSFGHMGGCIDNYSHFFYWNGPNRHDLWENGTEIWRDGQYFGDLMTEQVTSFIDKNREQPFFLYWAINWPHYPLQGTEKWRKAYADKGLEHPRDKYAVFVSSTDELLGKLLDHLEDRELRENTLVIFQSDHGHSMEERTFFGGGNAGPYRGHKGTLFEGGLRVPSVVSLPGVIPQGETRDQLVTGCDWFPTIDELTGPTKDNSSPDSPSRDGRSIVGVLKNADTDSPHERFYWQLGRGKNAQWAVREGEWKLIGNPRQPYEDELPAADRKEFLIHLSEDIGETTNVAKKHPEILDRLRKIATDNAADIERSTAPAQ